MVVVERIAHGVQVRTCGKQHAEVEDLMRTAPDVEAAGRSHSFRESRGVENSAEDVHCPMEDDEADAHSSLETRVAEDGDAMGHGDDARQTKRDEHGSAVRSPRRGAESVHPGDESAASSEGEDLVVR